MRNRAIDSLRVAAMLAVVALHAALAYAAVRPPDLAWLIYGTPVPQLDRLCLLIQAFVMPAFFTISGFSAASLSARLGVRDFLRHRTRRLTLPFIASLLVIMPVSYFLWGIGWFFSGKCGIREILRGRFENSEVDANLTGPGHLWFLEYLLLYTVIFAVFRVFHQKGEEGRWRGLWKSEGAVRIFEAWWRPFVFLVPTALVLAFGPQAVLHFKNSFVPEPFRFAHYFVFFLAGAWLWTFEEKWGELEAPAPLYLLLSIPAFILAEIFMRKYLAGPLLLNERAALGFFTALFMWLFLFGLIGLFSRPSEKKNRLVSADFTYWVYLVHFPWVAWAQLTFSKFPGPSMLKFLASFAIGLIGSAATYKIFMPAIRIVFAEKITASPKALRGAKARLTVLLFAIVAGLGLTYQHLYREERARTFRAVTDFYRFYLHREPDPEGLNYWTTMALTKYGLKRVEQEGFIDAVAKGAR